MNRSYELPPGATLRVTTSSGDITVIAEQRTDVQVPEGAQVESSGPAVAPGEGEPEERPARRGRHARALKVLRRLARGAVHGGRKLGPTHAVPALEVRAGRGGSASLEVRCPAGTAISIGTISGDVTLLGEFGDAAVTTTSGDVSIDRVAALDVRSLSGHIEVGGCAGPCRLHSKSGNIEARATGPAEAGTVSGRVQLRRTSGGVTVRTVSGNVELGTDGSEAVRIRTVSGQIAVRVPAGSSPQARLRSLAGKVQCECPQGRDFLLEADSVSGGIEVEPS